MTSKFEKFVNASKAARRKADPLREFDEALAELVIAGMEAGLSGHKILQVGTFNLTEFACEIADGNVPLVIWTMLRSMNLRLKSRIPEKFLDGTEEFPHPPEIEIIWASETGRDEAFFASNTMRTELEKFLDMQLKNEDCSAPSRTSH